MKYNMGSSLTLEFVDELYKNTGIATPVNDGTYVEIEQEVD